MPLHLTAITTSHEQKVAALIAEITAAFDGVSREDGMTLHEANAIDDYASAEERQLARALDIETRWQDVPDEDIQYGCDVLSFLDPKGFRYYIPAYMVWTLKNLRNRRCESDTPEHTVWSLMWSENADWKTRYSVLNQQQMKAIARFLHLLAEDKDGDARQALKSYWVQFL